MIPVNRNNSHTGMVCSFTKHVKGIKNKSNCAHKVKESHKKGNEQCWKIQNRKERSRETHTHKKGENRGSQNVKRRRR